MAARVPSSSVPRSSGVNRALRRWLAGEMARLRPAIEASAAACGAERYRKHFHSFGHASFLLFHGMRGAASLRQSYAEFGACPSLAALAGLSGAEPGELSVSFSQVAASTSSRPAAFLSGLLPGLLARLRQTEAFSSPRLPPSLHAIDSTFVRLSLGLGAWLPSQGGHDVAGVRVQVQYAPALDLPEHVLVTDTRTNDCQGWDQMVLDQPERLAALAGGTLVLDLGYYSHARFAHLRQAQVHFVSRRHRQASLTVQQELPVQPPLPTLEGGQIVVQRDCRVTLGSPNNRRGAVLENLRLIQARVEPSASAARLGKGPIVYELLTDRWDLDAVEVVQLYRWRWLIELFFRWLKSHVHLPRLLGYSRNAVELTLALALVVHLLVLLAARALGLPRRSPGLLRLLGLILGGLSRTELPRLLPASQLSLPGWAIPPPAPEPPLLTSALAAR